MAYWASAELNASMGSLLDCSGRKTEDVREHNHLNHLPISLYLYFVNEFAIKVGTLISASELF